MVRTTRNSGAHASREEGLHDRFARAVDDDVDGGVRDASDHDMERELAVVAALREAGDAAGPTRDEVDRMRNRVLAGSAGFERSAGPDEPATPSRVTPSRVTPMRSRRGGRHTKRATVAAEARKHLVVAAAATLCLLMSLSGMSLLLSRDALPGDALYAFKRSTESAELGLTFGEQARALKHLEFATARISEIDRMADRADTDGSDGSGGPDAARFLALLADFDSDTVVGTRMLTAVATEGDLAILSSLRGWAQQQQERLDDLRAALPAEAGDRISSSMALLDLVQQRAAALQDRAGCQNITSGVSDELGPLPAEQPCQPVPLDDAASAVPLHPSPTTAAPAPPDTVTTPSTTPTREQVATEEEQETDRPRLGDIFPNPGREDGGARQWWPDKGWPERDGSSSDGRQLVIPLPLLPDIAVPPSRPDDPTPR